MPMFVWRSTALENYAKGHIVVEAAGPPEARHKAIQEYERYLETHFDWAEEEYLNEKRQAFQLDLEGEYQEMEVLLVPGSE